jgi:hypothetical protein
MKRPRSAPTVGLLEVQCVEREPSESGSMS